MSDTKHNFTVQSPFDFMLCLMSSVLYYLVGSACFVALLHLVCNTKGTRRLFGLLQSRWASALEFGTDDHFNSCMQWSAKLVRERSGDMEQAEFHEVLKVISKNSNATTNTTHAQTLLQH